jgi:hypothetical protein
MLPIDLFRRPLFALSSATAICSFTVQSLAFVALPFYFQYVSGLSPLQIGVLPERRRQQDSSRRVDLRAMRAPEQRRIENLRGPAWPLGAGSGRKG